MAVELEEDEGPGRLESIRGPRVTLTPVVLRRLVGQHLERDAGTPDGIDGGGPLGRHGSDATDFGYAPGDPGSRRARLA